MARDAQSRGNATAGILDLLHLGAKMGAEMLRGKKADTGAAGACWARDLLQKQGGADLEISVPTLPIEMVADRARSELMLGGRPGFDGYEAGKLKTESMSFLAPGALTIANGSAWAALRPFNEQVLGTGLPHPDAQIFLGHVRAAFAQPVADRNDIAAAMGRAMVRIVVGELPAGTPDPAEDVTKLFDVVQSPAKRKLLGFLYKKRRERLYALLAQKRGEAARAGTNGERTLLAAAGRTASIVNAQALLEQTPHWMFTFTGSGTDLLTRTLCMVTSRPDVHAKALAEIRAAGPRDQADTIEKLAYLEACVLETGRLFPPVTRTFHRASGNAADSREQVHFFPMLQRDDRLGAGVHDFRPERWLSPELDEAARASNLFLRGPRACPGMDLILFVIKAAAAEQLAELGLSARQERLTSDPLPVSFPKLDARFTAQEQHR